MTDTNPWAPMPGETIAQMAARYSAAYRAYLEKWKTGGYPDEDEREDDWMELSAFEMEISRLPCKSLEDAVAKMRLAMEDETTDFEPSESNPIPGHICTAFEFLDTLVKKPE